MTDYLNEQIGLLQEHNKAKHPMQLKTKVNYRHLIKDPSAAVIDEQASHVSSTQLIQTSRIGTSERGSTKKGTQHMKKFAMVNHIHASPAAAVVANGLFQDLAHLSLPPLMSPSAEISSPLLSPSMKKQNVLPVKDGFECSNNVLERSMAQHLGLK